MRKLCKFYWRYPKLSPPQSFALFSKSCKNTERSVDEQRKSSIFIYIGFGGNLVPQTGPTCNSKLQIIKFSFVLPTDPKR